ncbi:hypothetical protein ACIO3O_29100 [Streptomyces sp. NPDC087440]|uniref:hypothetical protein n=1 Tax=Streptomyces sp. NPDC087440 TaxID=3365790 RepID=UPI00380FB956
MRTTSSGWTKGRVTSVVAGAVLALLALTLVGVGGTALYYASQNDGYIDLGTSRYQHRTDTYAMTADTWHADQQLGGLYDDLKVTFEPDKKSDQVFVGIAGAKQLGQYLNGVEHVTIHDSGDKGDKQSNHQGAAPKTTPGQAQNVWIAKAGGQGAQTLNWPVQPGEVGLVAMKADGSRGVSGQVTVAAKIGALTWTGIAGLVVGVLLLAGAVLMIVRPVRRARGRA